MGAYSVLRNWYCKFTGKALKPTPVDLQTTRETYVQLFTADNFDDTMLYKFEYNGPGIDDSVPNEEEITFALMQMRNGKAPGLTKISVDQLKDWYRRAHPKQPRNGPPVPVDPTAVQIWGRVVRIVQDCVRDGDIPDAFFNGILVIIPKDDRRGVCGIRLLETIHKLISQVINLRMAASIRFLDKLHGFRRNRGTYTAIREAKLCMQMATCRSETLYQIYLDMRKAYDSIDCGRVLQLLEKYRMGPNLRRYISMIWDQQHYILRQGGVLQCAG